MHKYVFLNAEFISINVLKKITVLKRNCFELLKKNI
jgi:hypothetical protein